MRCGAVEGSEALSLHLPRASTSLQSPSCLPLPARRCSNSPRLLPLSTRCRLARLRIWPPEERQKAEMNERGTILLAYEI